MLSVAGSAVIVEFMELGGGEAGGGDAGGGEGGDTGDGGGGVTEADGDVTGGVGGEAGAGGVAADCVTFTMRGTVIRREPPDPESQMYTRPELAPTFMFAVLTVTLTASNSFVMVLMLP